MEKNKNLQGFSTLEVLIAFVVGITAVSAVAMSVFLNQSIFVDTETTNRALLIADKILEEVRNTASVDYNLVVATASNEEIYTKELLISAKNIAQCSKEVQSQVSWNASSRLQKVSLVERLIMLPEIVSLGGNCDVDPPTRPWTTSSVFASSVSLAGQLTSVEVLNKILYVTGSLSPFLFISNLNELGEGNVNIFQTFTNGFTAGAPLNSVVVARYPSGKIYAFAARDTVTSQFQVVNVTDSRNPVSVGTYQLAGVSPSGSYPQGYKIFYYDQKVYILTRYTAGNELHVFDVTNPESPKEFGSGKKLGLTVNGLVVTKKSIGGIVYTFGYMASSDNGKELLVLNLSDPLNISEITGATKNLTNPDYADGNAVFLIGDKLYFGRDSSSPYDVYIFDVRNPLIATDGLPVLASQDVGTSVIGITVSGSFAFLSTRKANKEFQVWNSDLNASIVSFKSFGSLVSTNPKYEKDFVYVAGSQSDGVKILYSP